MRVSAALFLLPMVVAAAQNAPKKVDRELRARVNEFFQAHVDGNFRKAYEIVANDTKDYYFASQKVRFKSFKIDSIQYSDHFKRADVKITGERIVDLPYPLQRTVMPSSMDTSWKIEKGKWVWYDDSKPAAITPMGPSDTKALEHRGASASLPDLSQGAMKNRADVILKGNSAPDKSELVLPMDKTSSEQIVFKNGEQGSVKISVDSSAAPAGFTAELDKSDLAAGENATIKIQFDPKKGPAAPGQFTLRIIMEPFSRVFPVTIRFAAH